MLTRRTFFKGLAAAAGLTVVAPKLLLPGDADYQAWVARGKPRSWMGVGRIEQLSATLSLTIDPKWRAFLLAQTPLGCSVLYLEMLGIPKHMWAGLPDDVRRGARGYRPHVEKPSTELLQSHTGSLMPREYFHIREDGTPFVDMQQWNADHPQLGGPDAQRIAEFDRLEAEWKRRAVDALNEDVFAPKTALAFADEQQNRTIATSEGDPIDERVGGWWHETTQRRVQQRDAPALKVVRK